MNLTNATELELWAASIAALALGIWSGVAAWYVKNVWVAYRAQPTELDDIDGQRRASLEIAGRDLVILQLVGIVLWGALLSIEAPPPVDRIREAVDFRRWVTLGVLLEVPILGAGLIVSVLTYWRRRAPRVMPTPAVSAPPVPGPDAAAD